MNYLLMKLTDFSRTDLNGWICYDVEVSPSQKCPPTACPVLLIPYLDIHLFGLSKMHSLRSLMEKAKSWATYWITNAFI